MRATAITIGTLLLTAPASAQFLAHDSNPRIIHVPAPHVPEAPVRRVAPVHAATDEEVFERIERRRAQPRRSLAKSQEPALPRAEFPPAANESRRVLLNAPVPATGPGSLTPIYPTPRWRNTDPPPAVTADNNE